MSLPAQGALIGYWAANGNANDSFGPHDGTLLNGGSYGAGVSGQAFQFDGVNDYVSIPDDDAWTFTDFTISLWVNFDQIKAGSLPNRLVSHDLGPGEFPKWIFSYDSDGSLDFHINGPLPTYPNGGITVTSPGTFVASVGEWVHFAITRSGNTYTFYANSTSLGSVSDSTVIPNPAITTLKFGQAELNGYVSGRMDEIRIYGNALSAPEIAQLAIPEPSNIALWMSAIAVWISRRRNHRSQCYVGPMRAS